MSEENLHDDDFESVSPVHDGDVLSKERERQQLHEDIEAFLSKGGKIDCIDSSMRSDPPRKPESNYGGQPI